MFPGLLEGRLHGPVGFLRLCCGWKRCRVLFLMVPVSLHLSLSPYIIGTTNQPVKMTPNHGLHLSFRYGSSPASVPVGLGRAGGIAFAPGQSQGHMLGLGTLVRTKPQACPCHPTRV